jgi:hypothetical protein
MPPRNQKFDQGSPRRRNEEAAADPLFAELRRALEEVKARAPVGARETQQVRDALAQSLTNIIDQALGRSDHLWDLITPVVQRFARTEHDRDRAWFAGYGLDSEAATLPAIAAFIRQSHERDPASAVC